MRICFCLLGLEPLIWTLVVIRIRGKIIQTMNKSSKQEYNINTNTTNLLFPMYIHGIPNRLQSFQFKFCRKKPVNIITQLRNKLYNHSGKIVYLKLSWCRVTYYQDVTFTIYQSFVLLCQMVPFEWVILLIMAGFE